MLHEMILMYMRWRHCDTSFWDLVYNVLINVISLYYGIVKTCLQPNISQSFSNDSRIFLMVIFIDWSATV